MTTEDDIVQNGDDGASTPKALPWARASNADLADLDFEAPIAESRSAESRDLSELFRKAAGPIGENSEWVDTPSARVFSMLAGVTGMMFKPKEPSEPFGAMAIFADGRRSALPTDFRGDPSGMLAEMAARSRHPVLRARLADACWLLERKRGQFAAIAAAAYVEVVNITVS
jgi:hypothetical protein